MVKDYLIRLGQKERADRDQLIDFYATLIDKFPIVSIEDGLDENDWEGWTTLTERFTNDVQLVGDDVFVTNKSFVQRAIDEKAANSVLIKVNQIGSLTETFDTMTLCRENGYTYVDIYSRVCDKDGLMLPEYAEDKVHLNSKAVNIAKAELRDKLGIAV